MWCYMNITGVEGERDIPKGRKGPKERKKRQKKKIKKISPLVCSRVVDYGPHEGFNMLKASDSGSNPCLPSSLSFLVECSNF